MTQLQDARSTGDGYKDPASHCSYEESHTLREAALPAEEPDRDHVLVLDKEND
jgi:hypothetical protein